MKARQAERRYDVKEAYRIIGLMRAEIRANNRLAEQTRMVIQESRTLLRGPWPMRVGGL